VETSSKSSWLERNEFLLRRLHSLTGLIPVGAFMTVHLLVNASILDSSAAFQKNVYQIHSLGRLLPLVEWLFIFIPILFHGILGVVIIRGGLPNSGSYPYANNIRYTLQRVSGIIAFVFIAWHVFHMHGWFHFPAWSESVAKPLNGANFKPYSAPSTAALAMQQSFLVLLLYIVGIVASVYHLANGLWTMGITWGVWISPAAQRRASVACTVFGLALGAVGLGAALGFWGMDADQIQAAQQVEEQMYRAKSEAGEITEGDHKRAHSTHGESGEAALTDPPPRNAAGDRVSLLEH
jgi:succinate dehydrogenase / fumarate reductase cytochrome b subunit